MARIMPVGNIPVKTEYSCADVGDLSDSSNNLRMEQLKRIRQSKGLTQAQLAEKAQVTQGAISKLEKGDMNATIATILRVAEALDVSPAQLFGLPELQRRAVEAINGVDPLSREAALVVLESMAKKG